MNFFNKITSIALLFALVLFSFSSVSAGETPTWIGAFFVKGKVGLKWTAADEASQYKVYRKTATSDFELLLTVKKTMHFDTQVSPGETYTYKIGAIKADGTEATSDVKSVTIPGSKSTGEFNPPTWSGIRMDRNKLFLNWDQVPGAIAYNVYRSKTSGSGYELVGSSQAAKHADKEGLVQGITYYYVVTAMDEMFEETKYSEEMSYKFGMSAEEKKKLEEAANKIELIDIPMSFLFEIKTVGNKGDMNQPADVDIDSKGNIYITDAINQQVNIYSADGSIIKSFGEPTVKGDEVNAPDGSFSYPFSIFIDKQDNIFVTDVLNHNIQKFTTDGKFLKNIKVAAKNGQEAYRPNGIYVMDDGRIVTTDAGNHRFVIIDESGKILLEKGSRGSEDGQFIFPDGITVTKDNIICVVDVINCRIQEFDLDGNFIRKFGEPGQTAGTFGRPKEITIGEDGYLWVSDAMGHIIQIFTPEGEVKSAITKFDNGDVFLSTPRGMIIKNGRFYVINRLPHQLLAFKLGK